MSTDITIRGKHPSEKLVSLIKDTLIKGKQLNDIINQVWEQGAEEGFSKEEIREDIVRPIARQMGLNKDQVYYLVHRPEMLEKSRQQYLDLKSRNIPIERSNVHISNELVPVSGIPTNGSIRVEEWKLADLDKYDTEFLIKIIHHLYRKLKLKR
jgi:hypothetical protein